MNIKRIFNESSLFKYLKNRYVLTIVAFAVWITFIDDSSLIKQYKRSEELETIIAKRKSYEQSILTLKENIRQLEQSDEVRERFAREHYKMKKQNEDIFVFEDDTEKD